MGNLSSCTPATGWGATRCAPQTTPIISPSATPRFSPGGPLPGRGSDGPGWLFPQYFEYTSQRELRHNIGKELCLRAGAGAAELGECQFRGKPGRVPASEEWDLAQVRRPLRAGNRPWARRHRARHGAAAPVPLPLGHVPCSPRDRSLTLAR